MISRRLALPPALILTLSFGTAAADRAPTSEERSAIQSALTSAGFTAWEEIELDDGRWEVDDAIHSDGMTYDLELDPTNFAILKKERDG